MRGFSRVFIVLVVTVTLLPLTACEAAATPVGRVTETADTPSAAVSTATQTPLPALRYGFVGGAEAFAPDDGIFASAEALAPGADPASYDIVAAYGTIPEWAQSPVTQRVALVLNANLAPLAEEDIPALLAAALSPRDLLAALAIPGALPGSDQTRDSLAVRVALANRGYPDGLTLTLAAETIPGLELVTEQLAQSNIQTQLVRIDADDAAATLDENRAHLLLIRWVDEAQRTAWVERAGAQHVIDLFTLPIAYRANDDLALEFHADGWPIPASR